MQNVHFTPPELARILGVNESTIKRWIDRGLLTAERTSGGHRRIQEDDVQRFVQGAAKQNKHSYLLAKWRRRTEAADWRPYYTMQHEGRFHEARKYLHTLYVASGDIRSTLEDVVTPSLREIGHAWLRGDIDIADEHRMSFCIRSDLLALQSLIPSPPKNAPMLVLACTPNENHELSLILLSLIARGAGWQPVVLGINVPLEQVARAVAKLNARAVVLVKIYAQAEVALDQLETFCVRVAQRAKLFVGGPGWSSAELAALTPCALVQSSYTEFQSALEKK